MATPLPTVSASRAKGRKPPPSPLMKEGVSRIKNGIALERSFSSSGRATDGALAAGEYRIAKELMDSLSSDVGTPRSVRQALEEKAVEVQRRLDSLEVKLTAESRAQAQALAAAARADREEAAETAASAVKVQAAVRGRQARAATAVIRAERHRQHAAATRIQARRRANLARAELRAMSGPAGRVEFDLGHRADDELAGTDDELGDDMMGMLMSPSIARALAGPPPPPPPPQPYAERLAQLQHRHQELETEPPILLIDAPLVTASVAECTQYIQPLLQRTMQAVTCTAALQRDEQTALEYIARCFAAGELLAPEPEAETTPIVGQNRTKWSADRTLSVFLSSLEVKVANAMSTGIVEHLQAEEHQRPKRSDQWKRQLAKRIGEQLSVLTSNSLGGETPSALNSSLPARGQGPGVETATQAAAAAAAAAEAAQIQTEALRAALREELVGLRLSALRKRADTLGADEEMIDEAEDNEDPKQALVSLIVSLASSG